VARNPQHDTERYPRPVVSVIIEQSPRHITMQRNRFDRIKAVADAAIERDLCAAVNDDPELRTRRTEADLARADAELRAAIDAHHAASAR
jgi:hypothetical protein